MIMEKLKELFFYWSLALVFMTLPFPKDSLNSLSIIILTLAWLFYKPFSEKIKRLKKMALPFIISSSLFWLNLIGLFYTDDLFLGMGVVQKNLPFLILSIVIFSSDISKDSINYLFKIFSISVVAASLFAVSKALYFSIHNLGDFFYYAEFSKLLEIHTTYFALLLVLALVYFLFQMRIKNKSTFILYVTASVFLLIMIYIVSSRISIIALAVAFTVICLKEFKNNNKVISILVLMCGLLLTVAYLFSPNIQKRNTGNSDFGMATPNLSTRSLHWQGVINTISSANPFLGLGTGATDESLYNEYKELGFKEGYRFKYNAHNQFLESALSFGLPGIITLITILSFFMFISYKDNDLFYLTIALVFITFMMTESILERQKGIVVFALFFTSCLVLKISKKEEISA